MFQKIKKYQFLFEELVKRDFKQKYKRTVLGMAWSILSPLLQLLIMSIVFSHFFGKEIEHYTIYLFCGNLLFNYFKESTTGGMTSLIANADIFSKVNMPKYMFLLSKNVSSLINFCITILVFFLFCLIDGIHFHTRMLMLIYPLICFVVFNIGIGLILSALFVFFRDMSYLYDVFTMLLMYVSAIFYNIDIFSDFIQKLFLLNPLYVFIAYWRILILDGILPSVGMHLLCLFYAAVAITTGAYIYKRCNHKFLYYV